MDRISGLSDELLLKILLLVPTKVAVSTSILSRRWEYLWMSLPRLTYDSRNCSEPEANRLLRFLDKNLPLHRAPVIESFRLKLRYSRFKLENFNMWVVIALSHCLRELDIFFESHRANPIILPSNLFTCKSLAILKLDGDFMLDVPRMVSLPSLKTLKLQSVRFTNDETLQRLLSSCPVLEDLLVDLGERDITTRKFSVVVPSLLSLSLVMLYTDGIDGFVIDTPALKCFKLVDYNCDDYYCLLEHMPNLIQAHLHVSLSDIKSLIGSITSVKRLTICAAEAMMLDEGFVFNQLEHLELCLCRKHSSNQLVRLLKASPNLQGLHLFYMDEHDGQKLVYWNQPTTVPECISSSLESLSWSFYSGGPEERDIVVYILKHALHLKTATIKPSSESDLTQLEMLQELALSSRASAACQLMFECASED